MVSTTNSFDEVTVLIRNRINSEVKNLKDRLGNDIIIKTVSFNWPSKATTSESFPLIVIGNEDAEDSEFSYGTEEIMNRISIEVAALTNDEVSKIISKCYDAIKTYKSGLRELGVTNIRLVDKDTDNDEIGGMKVRRGLLIFSFTWRRPAW